MKIKNLAFFGIMAAIMSVAGTARADTTTVIASQAYVDAKDALKQDNLGGGTNAGKAVIATGTAGTVEYRAISGNASTAQPTDLLTAGAINSAITNATPDASNYVDHSNTSGDTALNLTDSSTKAPSVTMVKNLAQTSVRATGTADDTHFPTEKAVRDAITGINTDISGKVDKDQGTQNKNKIFVTNTTSGEQILVEYDNSHLSLNDNTLAVTDVATAAQGTKADNAATKIGDTTMTTSATTLTGAINELDTDISSLDTNKQNKSDSTVPATDANNTAITYNYITAGTGVGANLRALDTATKNAADAAAGAQTAADGKVDIQQDSTTGANKIFTTDATGKQNLTEAGEHLAISEGKLNVTGVVASNNAITGATKTKITYDSKGLVTAGADLEESDIPDLHLAKVTDVTATAAEVNKLAGLATTKDELGYVSGVTSAIQTQLDNKVVKNANITASSSNSIVTYDEKGLVTGGTAAGALATKDKVGNSDVTANSLVYKDAMNYQLSNVNDQGGDGSSKCLKGSPCTLTMFMNNGTPVYEWTNMDTESTDAVI